MKIRFAMILAAVAATACAQKEPPAAASPAQTLAPQPAKAAASFINKVWEVSDSPTVAPGQLYVFLSEGTLVIASSTSTPSLGKWKQDNGQLIMIEEGIAYPTDILDLASDRFRIRSHNPGEPVEIGMVLAHSD
jgi:hypothetical protein